MFHITISGLQLTLQVHKGVTDEGDTVIIDIHESLQSEIIHYDFRLNQGGSLYYKRRTDKQEAHLDDKYNSHKRVEMTY